MTINVYGQHTYVQKYPHRYIDGFRGGDKFFSQIVQLPARGISDVMFLDLSNDFYSCHDEESPGWAMWYTHIPIESMFACICTRKTHEKERKKKLE